MTTATGTRRSALLLALKKSTRMNSSTNPPPSPAPPIIGGGGSGSAPNCCCCGGRIPRWGRLPAAAAASAPVLRTSAVPPSRCTAHRAPRIGRGPAFPTRAYKLLRLRIYLARVVITQKLPSSPLAFWRGQPQSAHGHRHHACTSCCLGHRRSSWLDAPCARHKRAHLSAPEAF